MLLNPINNIRLESIIIESPLPSDSSTPHISLGVNASIFRSSRDNRELKSLLEPLRIRFVVATTLESAQSTDYITQRFNEYLLNEVKDRKFNTENPSREFVSYLDDFLGTHHQYLSVSSPTSGFSIRNSVGSFHDGHFTAGNSALSEGIYLYDAPLLDLVPFNNQGEIVSTSVSHTPNVTIDENSFIAENAGLIDAAQNQQLINQLGNISTNAELVNHLTETMPSATSKMPIMPVIINIPNVSAGTVGQLTVYALVYTTISSSRNPPSLALESSITPIVSATLFGRQFVFQSTSPDNPFVGMVPAFSAPGIRNGQLWSPQTDLATVISQNTHNEVHRKLMDSYYTFFSSRVGTSTHQSRTMQLSVKDDNYFSDFWATKNGNDKVQYAFVYDLISFLSQNSPLSSFYRNRKLAEKLISGDPAVTGLVNPFVPSSVREMKILRCHADKRSLQPVSELGTSSRLQTLGPDQYFPEKYVDTATPMSGVLGTDPGMTMFMGSDNAKDPHPPTAVKYRADYMVYDASPLYLREVVKNIMTIQSDIAIVYDALINTPGTTNVQGDYLTTSLSTQVGHFSDGEYSYSSAIRKSLIKYVNTLNETLGGKDIDITPYLNLITAKQDNLPLSLLEEIRDMVDVGLHFYYKKLLYFFPKNPFGKNNHLIPLNIKQKGLLESGLPLFHEHHEFSSFVDVGSNINYGEDYIFSEKDQQHHANHKGFANITTGEYTRRTTVESEKYFFQQSGEENPFNNVSFLSPRLLRVPNNISVDQIEMPEKGEDSYILYDIDRYGKLFSDFIAQNTLIRDAYYTTPGVRDGISTENKNERLYSSLMENLREHHGVTFKDQTTPQYESPVVQTGKTPPTTESTPGTSDGGFYRHGMLAIPSIVGGETDQSLSTSTYIDGVETALNPYTDKIGAIEKTLQKGTELKRPIKLPFAIFGELEIDPHFSMERYQDQGFNSLRTLVNEFGITTNNLQEVIGGEFARFPDQVKSLLMLAVSNTLSDVVIDGIVVEPRRPGILPSDITLDSSPSNLISVWETGADQPPFPVTEDPMKIYSKFMTFWLNYKQLAVVEYLSSFGTTIGERNFSDTVHGRPALDAWLPISQDLLSSLSEGEQVLCRVRSLSRNDYSKMLGDVGESKQQILTNFIKDNLFDLPTYNSYFFIHGTSPQTTMEDAPTTTFATAVSATAATTETTNTMTSGMFSSETSTY